MDNSESVTKRRRQAFNFYLAAMILTSIGLGLSDGVFGNYFKEVYDVTAAQRGFIEFPRELPGLLCVVFVSVFSFLGEIRLSLIAQILSVAGLIVLGLFTPPFAVMLIFLFINSMGMHLFMPLQDSIGLGIIGGEKTGSRLGLINGVKTAAGFAAGLVVFFGFRSGLFDFANEMKIIFLVSAAFFAGVFILLFIIRSKTGDPAITTGSGRFLVRKDYKFFYALASFHGAHKQIAGVFGPWVIIDILLKQADTLAVLSMIGAFIGIFFIPMIGKFTDRFGVKKMIFAEGVSYVAVYIMFGLVSAGLATGGLATFGLPVLIVYLIFIIDRMTMSLGMVRVIYLRSIARDQSEVSPTLSAGMTLDHIISIVCAYLGGIAWIAWGPQFVFYIAAALSLGNVVVAAFIPKEA